MPEKVERFGFVLAPEEKVALERLAAHERISAAAVVRRLVMAAAQQIPTNSPAQKVEVNGNARRV